MKILRSAGRHFVRLWFAGVPFILCGGMARADSLTITYAVNPHQTAAVQTSAFTVVTFTGSLTNNSSSPILFQLTGGPVPFEPYVASFVNGIGYPGITLGPGKSTGTIDLATVTLQFFDPSLTYPGSVKIVLEAIDPRTGNAFTENDASILVLAPGSAVPEPSSITLFALATVGLFAVRKKQTLRRTAPDWL